MTHAITRATNATHSEFAQAMVANIRAYYNRATDTQLRDGRAWYPAMSVLMREHSVDSGLTIAQCADIYAATSINAAWSRNIYLAARVISDYATGTVRLGGMLQLSRDYIIAIMQGRSIDEIVRNAALLKIRSFTHNLRDINDRVTIDRWAMRIATDFADCPSRDTRDDRGIPMPCKRNGRHGCGYVPKGNEYRAIESAYIAAAEELKERAIDLQAITWCVVRGHGE